MKLFNKKTIALFVMMIGTYVLQVQQSLGFQTKDEIELLYSDDNQNPFEQFEKMHERIFKKFKFPKKNVRESVPIIKREDQQFVYYDIDLDSFDNKKLDVKVENGQIQIMAQTEKHSSTGHSKSYSLSSFHQSFPVPDNVDADKVQMLRESNKLVVKFPKT